MAKAMSTIEKFKRVEAGIRDIALAARKAVEQIDTAMAGKRTPQELDALSASRADCERLQREARWAVGDFFDRVEGRPLAERPSPEPGIKDQSNKGSDTLT